MERAEETHIALVTGAANGIGYAIARMLAEAGYAVALLDIDGVAAGKAADEIASATGAHTIAYENDVTDSHACETAYEQMAKQFGRPKILVNNAGIMVRQLARLEDQPLEEIEEMMATHVGGSLHWSRLVLPAMREAGFGRIVNISSCNGVVAVPYRIGYVTAKKALRGVTEALALETARAGITVNAIAPGYILTETLKQRSAAGMLDQAAIAERTPVGRWGRPEEIASAVRFLVSKEASYITGTTLVIDGGFTVRADAGENLDTPPDG